MTQKAKILARLKSGQSLTAKCAIEHFNCYRLSARICELREEGHNILATMVKLPNGKTFARYTYLGRA